MSSILEKLAGAKALIEAAIEEELQRQAPPVETPPDAAASNAVAPCDHKNSEEITGAGKGSRRRACVDCGHIWEVE